MAYRESVIPKLSERWPLPVVKVYKSSNGGIVNAHFFRILSSMNANLECDLQLCGHYTTLIVAVFPRLLDYFTRAISELGGKVSCFNGAPGASAASFPTAALLNRGSVTTGTTPLSPILIVHVCHLSLLLFKTSSSQSYDRDMNSTIAALKSIARTTSTETDQIPVGFEVAEKMRTMLGSKRYLKKYLFEAIHKVSELDSPLGHCCNYVVRKHAWTYMSDLVLINDVLLDYNSPVLRDARVAWEVQNLHETFNAIDQSSSPQFFGITTIGIDERLLDSSRFPLLIKVAQWLGSSPSFTNSQIISTPHVNDRTVSQLVDIHKAYVRENPARSTGVLLSSLQL